MTIRDSSSFIQTVQSTQPINDRKNNSNYHTSTEPNINNLLSSTNINEKLWAKRFRLSEYINILSTHRGHRTPRIIRYGTNECFNQTENESFSWEFHSSFMLWEPNRTNDWCNKIHRNVCTTIHMKHKELCTTNSSVFPVYYMQSELIIPIQNA